MRMETDDFVDTDRDGYDRVYSPQTERLARTGRDVGRILHAESRMLPLKTRNFELLDMVTAIREVFDGMRPTARDLSSRELFEAEGPRPHGRVREVYDGELPNPRVVYKEVPDEFFLLAGTWAFRYTERRFYANPNYVHRHTYPTADDAIRDDWLRAHINVGFCHPSIFFSQFDCTPMQAVDEVSPEWLDADDDPVESIYRRVANTLSLYEQWTTHDGDVRGRLADIFGYTDDGIDWLLDECADPWIDGMPDPSKSPNFGDTYQS